MNNQQTKLSTPLFFCGLKHSGKTTHGRLTAEKRNLRFKDVDDLILESLQREEQRKELTIREFFRTHGKDTFMEAEAEVLCKSLVSDSLHNHELLYSLGGGVCDNSGAVACIKAAKGTVFYIRQEEAVLFARIERKGLPPFLDTEDPVKSFHRLFTDRDKKYLGLADFVIDISGERPIEESFKLIDAQITALEAGEMG